MVENSFNLALVAHALGAPHWGWGLAGAVVVRKVSLEAINVKNVIDPPSGKKVRDLKRVFTVLFAQHERGPKNVVVVFETCLIHSRRPTATSPSSVALCRLYGNLKVDGTHWHQLSSFLVPPINARGSPGVASRFCL
jgi:hypothetical protein